MIPKLRINNITTIDGANKYLSNAYEIIGRKVANDWTVKYKTKTYQILGKNYCPAKSIIYVKETFSGKVILMFKNQELAYKIL